MPMEENLDVIFRYLPDLKNRTEQSQIVAINRKSGRGARLGTPAGFIGKFTKGDVYYEVHPDISVRLQLHKTVISLFQTGETAEIGVRLRVSIPGGNVIAAAEALHDQRRSPAEVIADAVEESLGRKLEQVGKINRDALLDQIFENKVSWQTEVAAELLLRIGIQSELVIELPPGHGDQTRTVRTRSIDVFPKDTPQHAQSLTLSVVFARTQDPAPESPPRSEQEWEAWIRRHVQRIYQDSIGLFDHWFEKAVVEETLRSNIEPAARRIGRSVAQLVIEPVGRPPIERDTTLQEDVVWKGRWGYPITFVVRARLKLKRDGAGLYLAHDKPSLARWLNGKVAHVIDAAMFNRDFADLSEQGEKDLEQEVLARLSREAEDIGHTLELLVVVSRLDERKYLQRFEINEPKRRFPTKHPLVPAKIEIGLVMQLAELHPYAELFVEKRFESEVRAIAVQAVERVMKTVDAQDYFANWEPWPDHEGQSGANPVKSKPLRDQLSTTIRAEIERRFHPTLMEVQLRRVDNDVAELDSEARQIQPISVTPKVPAPDVNNDDEDCKVTVKFRFPGIHPKEVVEIIARGEQRFDRTNLSGDLENWTRACLRRLPAVDLALLDSERPLDIHRGISEDLNQRVVDRIRADVGNELQRAYGLMLDIMYVERHLSEKEQLLRDIESQPIRDARARVTTYETRRKQNVEFFDRDITDIRARILEYDKRIAEETRVNPPNIHLLGTLRGERNEQEQRLRELLGSNSALLSSALPKINADVRPAPEERGSIVSDRPPATGVDEGF